MDFELSSWRIIYSPPTSGAWNMALDQAILESASESHSPPTLRLYAWQPPCLSLGYAQPAADADLPALKRLGWELVRRPTGGRAILHTDELTYSVCGPQTEPRLAGGVLQSYRVLSQALLRVLEILGVQAQALEKPAGAASSALDEGLETSPLPGQNPVCFEMPSNYEITVGGKKLLGSAQRRSKEGVLQHGSLPLAGDLRLITQALAFPDETARQEAALRLARRAMTVEQALGYPVSWEAAAEAFQAAFSQALNLELKEARPSRRELARARQLVEDQYSQASWTNRM